MLAQVVGVEALRTTSAPLPAPSEPFEAPLRAGSAAQHTLIVDHINALRKKGGGLEYAQVCIIPEANLGFEAQHICAAVTRAGVRDWTALREGAQGSVGFLTTHATKEAGCVAVQELLSNGALSISRDFVSLSADDPAKALKQFGDQLKGFQVLLKAAVNPFAKARRTFTGKVGGAQDDMVIALQLAVLGARLFVRKEKYVSYR